MQILDCTLRDGANIVGKGFSAKLTKMMIEGLIRCNIRLIEMGNALGLGAYEADGAIAPLTDEEYLQLAQPYLDQAEIGMFIGHKNVNPDTVGLAAKYNIAFLRVGANAGDGELAQEKIRMVKKAGLKCRYSIMKGYILEPEALAEEALALEKCGLDEITIMDSAGTMEPDEVERYCRSLSSRLHIPLAFHGHNNLGLSTANALSACKGGAQVIDTGLMGMARSAGNCATELAVAAFQKMGMLTGVDLYGLLSFIDEELAPEISKISTYHAPVTPNDLVYGLAGCHSSFSKKLEEVAAREKVSLYKLIVEVSRLDRKAPGVELMEKVASQLKG